MQKPNLFIVGAPKSGSSFLYEKFLQHPQLFFPKVKELNHFSSTELENLNSYYKDFRLESRVDYLNFFKKAQKQKYKVDASVSYFTFPEVPQKIYDFNEEAKIVVILRNPIRRAFSHYLMDLRMGYANLPFNEYLAKGEQCPVHAHQYIANSLYWKSLTNYLKVFDKKDVCILILENIENDIHKLFDFLEISKNIEVNTAERVNENKKPKNIISKTLQKNRKLTSQLKLIIPTSVVKKFNGLLYEKEEKKTIETVDADYLKEIFHEDVKQLSGFLEEDLNNLWGI